MVRVDIAEWAVSPEARRLAEVEIRRDVEVGPGADGPLRCDLYLPVGVEAAPLVMLIHGGAWLKGNKEQFREWGPILAQEGFAAASLNYRLARPDRPAWPGSLDDVRTAHGWLRQNAREIRVDAERIGYVGASAGGHLASLMALDDSTREQVRAVVGVYGVYELPGWRAFTLTARDDDPVGTLIGALPEEAPQAYADASPTLRARALAARGERPSAAFFVVWGTADTVVQPEQSEAFAAALRETGADVETLTQPGVGHFWLTLSDTRNLADGADELKAAFKPRLLAFLRARL